MFHSEKQKQQALADKDATLVEIHQNDTGSFVHLPRVRHPKTRKKTGSNTVPHEHLGARQLCPACRMPSAQPTRRHRRQSWEWRPLVLRKNDVWQSHWDMTTGNRHCACARPDLSSQLRWHSTESGAPPFLINNLPAKCIVTVNPGTLNTIPFPILPESSSIANWLAFFNATSVTLLTGKYLG